MNEFRKELDKRVENVRVAVQKACLTLLPKSIDRCDVSVEFEDNPLMYPLTQSIVDTAIICVDVKCSIGDVHSSIGMAYPTGMPLNAMIEHVVYSLSDWAIKLYFSENQ